MTHTSRYTTHISYSVNSRTYYKFVKNKKVKVIQLQISTIVTNTYKKH